MPEPRHSGDLADGAVRDRLAAAVRAVDAPDVVFAYSRAGRRALCSGGTAPPRPRPREQLRYETGSASKTYGALLLARLHTAGLVGLGDPALPLLAPECEAPGAAPVTLFHLATHTSGLPRLPADLYPRAVGALLTNPYAGYPAARLVDRFRREALRRPARPRPGTRWRYSNFGAAILGHALAAAHPGR
ncbi:serine hydrolase, partial [Streptomyces boncukensis]|nr:beta-lactamase family protein [Streptomyces boncukensis]